MKSMRNTRGLGALIVAIIALAVVAAGTSSAAPNTGAVTRTFSFTAKSNSSTKTLFNINGILVNARCDNKGNPVVYAFSSASNADLFGHVFDGLGRLHIIKNSAFIKSNKGVLLSTTSGDFDSTGNVLFETSNGKVVTITFAFDNSTTLNKLSLCTVYGSYVAS